MARQEQIVVDGANVAFEERAANGKPKVSNLIAVRKALEQQGFESLIIVDASLWHEVDDPDQLDALIKQQVVRQAPAGTDADYFVLTTAQQQHAQVVSNDRYEPYREQFPWIDERRVPLMIVEGRVELYQPDLKR